ncbi:hypothetical protein [Ferrimicrobium sp.]|uniref:hypothetical protein n=1 Tax=Ferrimicrobium sp. TaxID=2926050 RepID=UPI002635EADE|nr:hypothetical protein [Ferrimicrobium sp.]
MRTVGTESWRFAHDIDQGLHVLLYLRDTLRLVVENGPIVPPPLDGTLPDRSELLDTPTRIQAARDWSAWWERVVAERARAELGPPPMDPTHQRWVTEVAYSHHLSFDPPEWSSLASTPALRSAARTLWKEASHWFTPARRPYLPPSSRDIFAWERVRHTAERVAATSCVDISALNGCALVVVVKDIWWELIGPGAAICSVGAARDPEVTEAILTAVFISQLEAI